MERLTTNKDVSDIEGMYELAHNSCYIDKDGNARYRDFETDVDARILTRELLKKYTDGDDAFISDDDFDNQMMEALQYGTDTREGLIALFYRNLWAMADLREHLKSYEDAEEQGLLLRLPCKVGSTVYMINRYWIDEGHICGIAESDDIDCFCYKVYCDPDDYTMVAISDFNETWFLTQAEAEQALAKMKEV